MTATGPAALALDEFLCNLTPEQSAAVRELMPTWLLDQSDAAKAEIHRGIQSATEAGIVAGSGTLPTGQYPAWLRLGLMDTLAAWAIGNATTCMHSPQPRRPQPVFSAAWKPGLIACAHCSHLLTIPRNSTKDRTCDGCGKITAGVDNGDPIYPASAVAGVLTYMFGSCEDCRYWELEPTA